MDKDTAARIIQRWFRSRFATKECVISHSSYLSVYEIVLDKQSYNANEIIANIQYSSQIPHSRREITENDFEYIHQKYDPFDKTYRINKRYSIDDNDYTSEVSGCSSKPPLSFILNKTRILYVQ